MRALSEWHPSGSSGTAVVQVVLHWQICSPLVILAMNLVPLAEEWSEWHSSGTLALNWLSLLWDESEWHSIGLLQIVLSLRIWLKLRPLIGRELWMLACHWSRILTQDTILIIQLSFAALSHTTWASKGRKWKRPPARSLGLESPYSSGLIIFLRLRWFIIISLINLRVVTGNRWTISGANSAWYGPADSHRCDQFLPLATLLCSPNNISSYNISCTIYLQ